MVNRLSESGSHLQKRPNSNYDVQYFNLDAILSVGYGVISKRGTQFRIWATRTLKEHLVRGYTLKERRPREKGFGPQCNS